MLGWFVETTLVASGLAVVAAMGGRLRSIGPTARHVLWLVVLVKLMTPPLICWPWAAHWGDLAWPLAAPPVAQAAPVVCADDSLSPPLTESTALAALDPLRTDFRIAPAATERAGDDPDEAEPDALTSPGRLPALGVKPADMARLSVGLALGWLFLTILLGLGQASRIIRFRGRLRAAVPAPDDLVEEARRIGLSLGVHVPELLVVPDLGTPLLWCLGRPKLLLPAQLVKRLDLDRWRGILTHELAHLRRGDHWVSRLELAAGLIWWWNPVYWLARARLDAEAELACDAWVVSTLPKDRLAYAEALFNIGSTLSMAKAPAPALGAAGSGRFFERRLTMILHDHVPCRLSPLALLVACLLALFALPSWSTAKPVAISSGETAVVSLVPTVVPVSATSILDDDDDADDDDDDDDTLAKARADFKKAEAALKKIEANTKKIEATAKKTKAKADAKKAKATAKKAKADAKEPKGDVESDPSKIGKEIEGKFGPDFEKKMEELGEKIGKEMEAKFGPGSDFEKQMKNLGKEMEAKLGPGSEFEKQMKGLGKEMEAKFGPGSEFEKQMKGLGKEMEAKFGPGSDFGKKAAEVAFKRAQERLEWAKRMQEKGYVSEAQKDAEELALEKARSALAQAQAAKKPKASSNAPAGSETAPAGNEAKVAAIAKDRRRERRIAAPEAQIRKLADELKALKADDDQD